MPRIRPPPAIFPPRSRYLLPAMPPTTRRMLRALVFASALGAGPAAAQASPYLTLDDPRLPLLEHLITRGDVMDPSPLVRPFRRADAERVLAAADTLAPVAPVAPAARLIGALRASLREPPAENRWRLAARAGGQAFSHIRRDVLHPLGPDGARPYADFTGEATAGNFALASRLAAEPRIVDDPEWPGRRDLTLAWRMVEAYVAAQFKYATLFYGQIDRNWGPVGLPGIGVSNYGYARVETGLEVGTKSVRLAALASSLRDERDSLGQVVHRYFFAHRLGVRVSDRLHFGLWETTVLAGVDRAFDGRYRNPLALLLLSNQYGLGADGNVLVGLDARWRVRRRITLEGQLGIDDLQYETTGGSTRYPNRYAFTLAGYGALGRRLGWRALYTRASSLAFRTLDPTENLTDAGVGLGRNFDDRDQVSLLVTVPAGVRWLLTPELTLQRQGEGNIGDPFPTTPEEAGRLPGIFIGVVERTWRAAVGVSGRQGPLDLTANAGFHHVVNAGHEAGRTVNRFEGRLQATIGITRGGELR